MWWLRQSPLKHSICSLRVFISTSFLCILFVFFKIAREQTSPMGIKVEWKCPVCWWRCTSTTSWSPDASSPWDPQRLPIHSRASKSNSPLILIYLRKSRILVRSGRCKEKWRKTPILWRNILYSPMTAREDVLLTLSTPLFFEKRFQCNSIHSIHQIFTEHLLCDRLGFRGWEYSSGQNKVPALVELTLSRVCCVGE